MSNDYQTYQLHIRLEQNVSVKVGKLGACTFPAGNYIYTGSAKRNMQARIKRHLSKKKKLKWHIDYLIAAEFVKIFYIEMFEEPECLINQRISGEIICPKFGASDCKQGCGSHLKYLGTD